MASHHKHHMKHKKARGGAMAGRDDYTGSGDPNVVKEAEKKKHGGKVHGHKGHHRIHKARGGGLKTGGHKSMGERHGKKGADHTPFSSAYTPASEAE
jgi:hypothetical protein